MYTVVQSGDVPEKSQTLCVNNFSECRLIGSALYFITGNILVPFNSKEHTEASLMEGH